MKKVTNGEGVVFSRFAGQSAGDAREFGDGIGMPRPKGFDRERNKNYILPSTNFKRLSVLPILGDFESVTGFRGGAVDESQLQWIDHCDVHCGIFPPNPSLYVDVRRPGIASWEEMTDFSTGDEACGDGGPMEVVSEGVVTTDALPFHPA